MSEKNRARQEAFTKRRQAEGLKRFQFWATPEEKDYLKKALDDFRDNGESTTPIHRETLVKGHNTFQDELLEGKFPSIRHKYPAYTMTSLGIISVIGIILFQKVSLFLQIRTSALKNGVPSN